MGREVARRTPDVLTPRQRRFVMHPDVLTDPERAALDAGYIDRFAKGNALTLQRELMPYIMQADSLHKEVLVDASQVAADLHAMAFGNIFDYFEVVDLDTGSRLALKQNLKAMPEAVQRCVKRIRFETVVIPGDKDGETHTMQLISDIELYDRSWALKELIEILGVRRQPNKPKNDELLDNLDAKDLESLEQIYGRAAERARDKRRDREAIPG